MNIQLRKFKPDKIADDKVCVFIGKRGTGKSTLVTDIMYHKRHIPVGLVMSATEEGNHYYKDYVPDSFIYGEYDKEVVEKLLGRQKKMVGENKPNPNAYLLLDDCMYDKKFLKDTCIRQCFMNGRHWKLFFMLTMQYCMDLDASLRANIDYVFVLRENIIGNRERLWKNFFGIFPTFDMFNQVMNACTENYECLVIDNTAKSNKLQDCVFWYKADIRRPFHMGSPSVWNYHKKNYNPNNSKDADVSRIKNKTTIKVTKT